jgi:hypothetical protein
MQMEAWNLEQIIYCRKQQGCRWKRGLYYILQKIIRIQIEAWTLLDRGSILYALIHEARIRRELIT